MIFNWPRMVKVATMTTTTATTVLLSWIAVVVVGATCGNANKNSGPLYLTPLIQAGNLSQARAMSNVTLINGMDRESYSGFFTVKQPDKAHMFFWFFPALENRETAPVILWMSGGPGSPATEALFYEIGPYQIDGVKLRKRQVTWTDKFSVIFLDTPLGSGFSHVKSADSFSSTSPQIGKDVHSAIVQFFTLFNEYRDRPFYVAGESYAAKFAINLAMECRDKSNGLNITGLVLLSSYYDPVNQMENANFAYETGIITKAARDGQSSEESLIKGIIQLGVHALGYQAFGLLKSARAHGKRSPGVHGFSYVETGMINSLNIQYDLVTLKNRNYVQLLNVTELRQAVHVGDLPFTVPIEATIDRLGQTGDLTTSFRPELEQLLNDGIRVLAVAGNMDWLIPPASSSNAADALQWRCGDIFRNSKRLVWYVHPEDNNSAGYIQCACGYCYALIRNGGHFVAMDEPVRTLHLVRRFVERQPLTVI